MGTAGRTHSTPKTTCVKANRTLDAVSDGAFAATRITTCAFCLGSCYSRMKPPNPSAAKKNVHLLWSFLEGK